jgi:hypothetical protein
MHLLLIRLPWREETFEETFYQTQTFFVVVV